MIGCITPLELQMFQSVPSKEFNTYWIPCTWFISLLKQTRKSNRLTDPQGLKVIIEEFNDFRSKCGMLWSYDWISIPLVYTQVVTLATYSFFLAALVGRQYVDDAKKLQMEIDRYIPVFTILQFFFFMGLLKVAEQLINPFGDDDEDFELNWLIDRHTKVSYLGVDTLMNRCPPLVKDKYFDDVDVTLPYTGAAFPYKKKTYRGSVHDMQVPEDQQSMFLPEILEEDEDPPTVQMGSTKTSLNSCVLNDAKKGNFNKDNASDAAGILRSEEEQFNFSHHPAYLEGDLQYMELGLGRDIEEVSVPTNQSEMFFWPSNSTLESNTSTAGLFEDILSVHNLNNSYSINKRKESVCSSGHIGIREYRHEPSYNKVQRSISSVFSSNNKRKKFDKYNSTGDIFVKLNNVKEHSKSENAKRKLQKILGRRQSNSSGQWKGVRWKPVIDDSGDCWSDNSNLKNSKRLSTPPPQQKFVGCMCQSLQTLQTDKPVSTVTPSGGVLRYSEPNIDFVSGKKHVRVVGSSLPNLSVVFSSSSKFLQECQNAQKVLQCSSSNKSVIDEKPQPPFEGSSSNNSN